MKQTESETPGQGSFGSTIRLGLMIFVMLVSILALLAWLAGDFVLPMQYEGFD